VVAAGVTLLLVLGVAAVWVTRPAERADAVPQGSFAAAQLSASQACSSASTSLELVEQNAPGEDVLLWLSRAVDSARTAVVVDSKWVQLLSGLQTLQFSLMQDDGSAAITGLELVRRNCAEI
jgi:hypothetical protein